MDDINTMPNQDRETHAECANAETVELLRERSAGMKAFPRGPSGRNLDPKCSMPALNRAVMVEQPLEHVVFRERCPAR